MYQAQVSISEYRMNMSPIRNASTCVIRSVKYVFFW